MKFELDLNKPAKKVAVVVLASAACSLLALILARNLIVGVLTDDRVVASPNLLAWGVGYAPDSAPLQARLAEAELLQADRNLSVIKSRVLSAINVSPWNYRYRSLLATVEEATGDRTEAESSLREAVALAPNNHELHWRLANLLLREGKLGKSLQNFRKAAETNISYLPATLDLVWRASGGNIKVVEAVTPAAARARLLLAQFLLNQSRVEEAVGVFSNVEREARLTLAESPAFIGALIKQGHHQAARDAWVNLLSTGDEQTRLLVWNGGFESNILTEFSQFDWNIIPSDYARIGIDTRAAHTGTRSLRVDFTGRDTTRLYGQIKQAIVVRPGTRYRLECFVRTGQLETPEGPRVVVATDGLQSEVASSDPISPGSSEWQRMTFDFVAPGDSKVLVIYIKRMPKFSYDAPTRGSIWFDDFTITELGSR